jgi:hypothetical protein
MRNTARDTLPPPPRGYTVADLAKRYRVSPDKVRVWIARGELLAINTASILCGRPRYLVLPESLARFERGRAAAAPPNPPRRRRHVQTGYIDYFPDD